MSQELLSEELEEMIWENYEKTIPQVEMNELREKYDQGWNQ